VEVEKEISQAKNKKGDEDVPPELNALHQILKQYKVVVVRSAGPVSHRRDRPK